MDGLASPKNRLLAVAAMSAVCGGVAGGLYASRGRTPAAEDPPKTVSVLTPRDIALRSFASVVLVTTKDMKGRPIASGSGFVVRKGVVATSFHVLRGAASGNVRLVGEQESIKIAGVFAVDEATDLAVLAVPSLEAAPLPLGESNGVAIGDRIFVVGNPQDLEGTFSEGIVSGKRKLDGVRMLQITAPISGGSSGGPVLDGRAEVVGVAASSLRSGQNLNFAINGDYLAPMLQNLGDVQELAKVAGPPPREKPVQTARAGAGGFFRHLARWLHLR
jgi:S1-C subfamily serine protease